MTGILSTAAGLGSAAGVLLVQAMKPGPSEEKCAGSGPVLGHLSNYTSYLIKRTSLSF